MNSGQISANGNANSHNWYAGSICSMSSGNEQAFDCRLKLSGQLIHLARSHAMGVDWFAHTQGELAWVKVPCVNRQ